jgi:hypothetical protein
MKAKLLTRNFSIGSIYAGTGLQWAFVRKKEEDYELVHEFFSCKDYMHEMIANAISLARDYLPKKNPIVKAHCYCFEIEDHVLADFFPLLF